MWPYSCICSHIWIAMHAPLLFTAQHKQHIPRTSSLRLWLFQVTLQNLDVLLVALQFCLVDGAPHVTWLLGSRLLWIGKLALILKDVIVHMLSGELWSFSTLCLKTNQLVSVITFLKQIGMIALLLETNQLRLSTTHSRPAISELQRHPGAPDAKQVGLEGHLSMNHRLCIKKCPQTASLELSTNSTCSSLPAQLATIWRQWPPLIHLPLLLILQLWALGWNLWKE